MTQGMKAALLSALVFPGVGQISVGKKQKGWAILISFLVLLGLLVMRLVQKAQQVLEQMQQQGLTIDVDNISGVTNKVVSFSDNAVLNTLLIIVILIWLVAIVDAYLTADK